MRPVALLQGSGTTIRSPLAAAALLKIFPKRKWWTKERFDYVGLALVPGSRRPLGPSRHARRRREYRCLGHRAPVAARAARQRGRRRERDDPPAPRAEPARGARARVLGGLRPVLAPLRRAPDAGAGDGHRRRARRHHRGGHRLAARRRGHYRASQRPPRPHQRHARRRQGRGALRRGALHVAPRHVRRRRAHRARGRAVLCPGLPGRAARRRGWASPLPHPREPTAATPRRRRRGGGGGGGGGGAWRRRRQLAHGLRSAPRRHRRQVHHPRRADTRLQPRRAAGRAGEGAHRRLRVAGRVLGRQGPGRLRRCVRHQRDHRYRRGRQQPEEVLDLAADLAAAVQGIAAGHPDHQGHQWRHTAHGRLRGEDVRPDGVGGADRRPGRRRAAAGAVGELRPRRYVRSLLTSDVSFFYLLATPPLLVSSRTSHTTCLSQTR